MKKIAILAGSVFTVGGEQRVITVIANELSLTYDVTIFTADKILNDRSLYGLSENIQVVYYNPFEPSIKNKICASVSWHFPRISRKLYWIAKEGWFSKRAINSLVQILKGKFDVAIAVSGDYSMLLGYASDELGKIKKIGWEHNSYEAYFETPKIYYYAKYRCFLESVKRLDKCIVLNEYIAKRYKERFNVDCDVIYNPRSFISDKKSNLQNFQFIAGGRFVYQKGFDLLIESFYQFSKVNSDWKLVLVGDGPERTMIEKKIEEYNLNGRVILPGYVSNIKDYLLESSVYLLSSRWEGFPMCITEAYEIGLPVIGYDISAMKPLMKNKEGITVKCFDTSEFSKAMVVMANSVELRKEMGANAVSMANTLSMPIISKKWISVLESEDLNDSCN